MNLKNNKLVKNITDLKVLCKSYKANNKKIVMTNGCFDILHSGHTYILEQSKKLGDILIVALNSDISVKKIKQLPNIEENVVNNIKDKHQEEKNKYEKDEIDEETIANNMNVKNIKPSWEGKILSLPKIAKLLKRKLRECGVTNLEIGPNDVVGIRNRKRFLQLLPILI